MKSLEDLDICKFMKTCNPDDEDIENYCCMNYENCEIYIKARRKYDNLLDDSD